MSPSPKRNVEDIRRSNLEENQLFLQSLFLKDMQNDFVESARSFLRAHRTCQTPKKATDQENRTEYMTRYRQKVKSGEIVPGTPEWKRLLEAKKKKTEERMAELLENQEENLSPEELRLLRKRIRFEEQAKMRHLQELAEQRQRWKSFFMNRNPYERVLQPRHDSVFERIRKQRR